MGDAKTLSNPVGYWWARLKPTEHRPDQAIQVVYVEPPVDGWDKSVQVMGSDESFRLDEFDFLSPLVAPEPTHTTAAIPRCDGHPSGAVTG